LNVVHHCSFGSPVFVPELWSTVQFFDTETGGFLYPVPTAQPDRNSTLVINPMAARGFTARLLD
jgi:hypothetical protein